MKIDIDITSWRESPEAAKTLYAAFPRRAREDFDKTNALVIARVEGKFAGVVSIYQPQNQKSRYWLYPLFNMYGSHDIVDWFAVHPKYRRRGIGAELLYTVHDLVGSTYAWVLMDNLSAQRVYRSVGYQPVKVELGVGLWLKNKGDA